MKFPGILCIESEQAASAPASARNLIRLLRHPRALNFCYERVQSPGQLRRALRYWSKPSVREKFPVLFLSFHGEAGRISIGNELVSLRTIARWLTGGGEGGFIHFSSCLTILRANAALKGLLEASGADVVCGYSKEVDVFESLALEVALFPKIFEWTPPTPEDFARAVRWVQARAPGYVRSTGFKAFLRV